MRVFNLVEEIVAERSKQRKSLGFVPTMGYLHDGHLSLARRSLEENEKTLVSIFVNPAQFGGKEDLSLYPSNIERDKALLESLGVDYLFLAQREEIYPEGYGTWVDIPTLGKKYCGVSRPVHFRGVLTIIVKLFNIIKPDYAYFGKKDYQQFFMVKKMVRELNLDVNIRGCPVIREEDGLAMSSRNAYLSKEERKEAVILNRVLISVKTNRPEGNQIRALVEQEVGRVPFFRLDYFEVASKWTLEPQTRVDEDSILLIAGYFGQTRLIDNMEVREKDD